MNSRILPILLAAASFLLGACVPESINPLSTPATSRIDSRIEGVYAPRKETSDKSAAYWHFHYRGAKPGADKRARVTTWIEMLSVAHEAESGIETTRHRALATRLGGRDYLSFVKVDSDGMAGKGQNYRLARYDFNWRGDLRIWDLDDEAIAAAITSGKLRGKVKVGKNSKEVLITDTTPRLAAFVAAGDPAKLFNKEPMVFRRVAR
jgi:hypothetical protein